jgi:hypothetical protein
MRIVNYKDILELPNGRVFSIFNADADENERLCAPRVKVCTKGRDIVFRQLPNGENVNVSAEHESEIQTSFHQEFTHYQHLFSARLLFAIWSRRDVLTLIESLTKSLLCEED